MQKYIAMQYHDGVTSEFQAQWSEEETGEIPVYKSWAPPSDIIL